ncbi:MAG TPA: hypothetical protein VIG51_11835 [Candidatus Baltobacteraceae bacterium]|jgi:hypothetical protein
MQIIRRNFGLKLLSLVLAIVGWAYFRYANNPVIAARFDQQLSVPIAAINVPVGYEARFTEKEAVVAVSPQRGQPAVKPDEIKAVLDLSRVVAPLAPDTVMTVPVTIAPSSVVVQSLSPASVVVTVEKVEQKTFTLVVHYSGQAPNVVVRNAVTLSPGTAVIHGPAGALAQVTAVRVDVPIPANASQLDEMVRPRPVNSLGGEVQGLQVSPDLIRVQARFTNGTGTKS